MADSDVRGHRTVAGSEGVRNTRVQCVHRSREGRVWRLVGGGGARTLTNGLEHGRALWVLVEAARTSEAHIDGLRHLLCLARVPSKDGGVKGEWQPVVRHSRSPREVTAPAGMDPSEGTHGTGGLGPCELGVQAAHDLPPTLGRVQLVLLPGTRGAPRM